MGKAMARIKDGVVWNVEWADTSTAETDTLKTVGERPVMIGDTYVDGKFYRSGNMVLTPLEEAQWLIAQYESALCEIEEALGVLDDD